MLIEITYNVTDVYMSTTETPVYVEISFEQPGGTSAVWGSITGTLSNQTDLQNALNAKFDDPTGTTAQYLRGDGSLATFPSLTGYVPYTGATTNVDLGEYELKAGQLTLDVSPTGTAAVGTTRWNDTTGVSETTLKGGNVLLRNGVDLVARVVNKVTPNTTLTKAAYQAVRVSGAQGQRLAVAFAQANNDANSADTIGLVIETIPTNQEGFIMAVGQLENINTTGSLQGETWVDGDVLYLSPTTAGAITNVKPTGNGHIVVIGYVEYAHANNGKIYVKVMNGWELDELHDVAIVTPLNNEALIYESSSALWKNKSIATALGYTPANAATTLTINGVSYDLSTSRTWNISAGISGSGTAGQVTYWSGASAVTGSNNLFWDNAQGRLGIGTNAPAAPLDVRTTSGFDSAIFKSQYTALGYIGNDNTWFWMGTATGGGGSRVSIATQGVRVNVNGTEYARFGQTGNLTLQNGGTFADSGQRLQVIGDTLLRGSGATNTTTALTVQNSSSTALFSVRNDGNVGIGVTPSDWGSAVKALQIGNISGVSLFGYSGGAEMGQNVYYTTIYKYATSAAASIYVQNNGRHFWRTASSGTANANLTFTTAMMLDEFGKLGIMNTPTAYVDVSASTTSYASLRLRSGTAPTSPNDGDIWFDGTDIKMRIGGVTKTFTLI